MFFLTFSQKKENICFWRSTRETIGIAYRALPVVVVVVFSAAVVLLP